MERNKLLDLFRGVAISLVLIGHTIQGICQVQGLDCFNNVFFKTIYTFHMPLFMLISGYLFYFTLSKQQSATNILARRLTSFILPIFTLSSGIFVLTYTFSKSITLHAVFINFLEDMFLWRFWFLWSILINICIITIACKLSKKPLATLVVIGILSIFIPDNIILAEHKFVYPFFVLGFIANKNKLNTNKLINKKYIIILTIIYIVLWYNYGHNNYIYTTGFSVVGKSFLVQIHYDMYRFITGLTGSLLFMLLLYKLRNYNWAKVFVYLGKRTMGIYVLQMFAMAFMYKIPMRSYSFILNFMILLSFLGCFSILGTILSEKIKILRYIILGKVKFSHKTGK